MTHSRFELLRYLLVFGDAGPSRRLDYSVPPHVFHIISKESVFFDFSVKVHLLHCKDTSIAFHCTEYLVARDKLL